MTKVCFSTNQLIIFLIFNIGIIIYLATNSVQIQSQQPAPQIIIKEKSESIPLKQPIEIVNYPRDLNDPLKGPERNRINHINYTNVGFVTSPTGDKYILFGRQKSYRSTQYEYYITDSDNQNIKYPVKYKNYNEIYDKDTVNIPEIGGDSTTTIYDLPEIRYSPY